MEACSALKSKLELYTFFSLCKKGSQALPERMGDKSQSDLMCPEGR